MSGYDALDELYEKLRDAEETQHAQRAGGITPEAIRAARGGVADGHGRECHVVDENAADGDSGPLAGDSRDTRERIEADAWEAARLDMSRTWEERRDAIVALLDRQAALTEREACAYCDYKDANRRQAHKIHEVCKCLEDSHEREKKLQAEVDELNAALGSGECEMAFGDDMLPECGNCGEPLVYYTKRHGFDGKDKRSASFCPRCGKAVKR